MRTAATVISYVIAVLAGIGFVLALCVWVSWALAMQ